LFQDAYKSPISIIILDDIERLLEYVPIGQRFSNAILQTLHVCLKKTVKGKKMLILGTTSKLEALRAMQLADEFSTVIKVPDIHPGEELSQILTSLGSFPSNDIGVICRTIKTPLPIKSIILFSEMAKQFISQQPLSERFIQLTHEFLEAQTSSQFSLY
jgi:vesicle-fusing ATPase